MNAEDALFTAILALLIIMVPNWILALFLSGVI